MRARCPCAGCAQTRGSGAAPGRHARAMPVGQRLHAHLGCVRAAHADHRLAMHRHAVVRAPLRKVVVRRVVLGGAVVPHHDGVRLPLHAQLELRDLSAAVQVLQQHLALVVLQALDLRDELRIHVDQPLAADRMHPHHRMRRIGMLALQLAQLGLVRLGAGEQVPPGLEVVDSLQAVDVLLHALGQTGVGRGHARKQRVTTVLRHHLGAQDGGQGRRSAKGFVRMPLVRQRGRVVGRIVEHDHLALVVEVRTEGVDGQFAKQAAKGHLLLQRDVLVAKHQHLVAHKGGVERRELLA